MRDVLAWAFLAVLMTALVIRVLPRTLRPTGLAVPAVACIGALVAVAVADATGFTAWLDDDVIERVGAESDDFGTWLVACAASLVVPAAVAVTRGRDRR